MYGPGDQPNPPAPKASAGPPRSAHPTPPHPGHQRGSVPKIHARPASGSPAPPTHPTTPPSSATGSHGVPRVGASPGVSPTRLPIPPGYLRLYKQAAGQAGIDWAILAAIGSIETDHGRSTLPGVHDGLNDFGCCAGPMQFNLMNGHPSTWETYATDGDGDGHASPYVPADAIASAARKLVADGAPGDYRRALLRYNNDPAYVEAVLQRAAWYRATGGEGEYAWPLAVDAQVIGVPGQGTHTLGNWQSDNAVDLAVPVGTPVHAVCDGVVESRLGFTAGGFDSSSRFGGLKLTLDCGVNRFWYGHLSAYTVGIVGGTPVKRGQEIGRSGAANGVPHLHLGAELGDPRDLFGIGSDLSGGATQR